MKERRPERNKASTMTRGSGGKDFQLFSGTKKARRKRTRNTWVPWFASWVTIHWFSLHYGLAFTINFKMDYPTIYKLLLIFSSEELLMIERDYFFSPAFRIGIYAGLKNFQKKPNFLWKSLYSASLLSLFWFATLDLLHCFSLDSFCRLLRWFQDDFPS